MNEYGLKKRGNEKVIRRTDNDTSVEKQKKPAWLKVKCMDSAEVIKLKDHLRNNKLHTVCEEAFCPNIGECFSSGTATFMVLGDICTRRCSFCDVAHGRPLMPDPDEPRRLAESVSAMKLKYVVITSVDRDDLDDGGSKHFARCIQSVRENNPDIRIEILIPDFKKCLTIALNILSNELPDVLNHNIETVPRLYRNVRPGSAYQHSLNLLKTFKILNPSIPTKSGIMLGLGESKIEVIDVLHDLRNVGVDLVTIGQYLAPSKHHTPVDRYVRPEEFKELEDIARLIGFKDVASGPLVRSSYHADEQSKQILSTQ
jgi:lipoic acid synthetase